MNYTNKNSAVRSVFDELFTLRPRAVRAGRRLKRAGFTIVEVAIAATVMTLVIATSITTMQRAFTALDTARSITVAGQIMQGEIERLRMKDWNAVSAYATSPTTLTIDSGFGSIGSVGTRFSLSRSAADPVPGEIRSFTYTVSWTGIDGQSRTRSFTINYARNGLYDYAFINRS